MKSLRDVRFLREFGRRSASMKSDGSFGRWIDPDERGQVFGKYAQEYDEHRPLYPKRVFEEILSFSERKENLQVIDVATGTGRAALALSEYSNVRRVVATDIDLGMIETAKKNGTDVATSFRVSKAESLSDILSSKEKNQFDIATVFQAFHWFDAEKVLKELRDNVLRDGAILAVAVCVSLSPSLSHTHTNF